MQHEYIFKQGNNVHVMQYKASANRKLGMSFIIGTYHFSLSQVTNISLIYDKASCFDCPFSFNMNNNKSGGCYTHKGLQRMGLNSMLKRLNKLVIEDYSEAKFKAFIKQVRIKADLVRFGIYGEPILMPIEMVKKLASLGNKQTGYTHQWYTAKKEYAKYFMASVNNSNRIEAENKGWRCFVVSHTKLEKTTVCPASKEASRKLTCSTCGLCNGIGQFTKNIQILQH